MDQLNHDRNYCDAGCVLNLATSCCQIESPCWEQEVRLHFQDSPIAWRQGGAALSMSVYLTDAVGQEVRFDFG